MKITSSSGFSFNNINYLSELLFEKLFQEYLYSQESIATKKERKMQLGKMVTVNT